jgi:hypothetical protein
MDILMSVDRSHRKTRRALPNSRNLAKTRRMVPATCSSGSISILPASPQQKPGGSMNRNSPRFALESRAAIPRCRIRLSSYSDIVATQEADEHA